MGVGGAGGSAWALRRRARALCAAALRGELACGLHLGGCSGTLTSPPSSAELDTPRLSTATEPALSPALGLSRVPVIVRTRINRRLLLLPSLR